MEPDTMGACIVQGSSEVLFRKVKFWDGGGQDAPPVFHVDGVNYLYVKVSITVVTQQERERSAAASKETLRKRHMQGLANQHERSSNMHCI